MLPGKVGLVPDVTSDLDVIERELRVLEVLPKGHDQSRKPSGKKGRGLFVDIGLSLVPENSTHFCTGTLHLSKHRPVERLTILVTALRAPTLHGAASVRRGDQSDRHAGMFDEILGECQPQTRAARPFLSAPGTDHAALVLVLVRKTTVEVHRVTGLDPPVQRLDGELPTLRHGETVHEIIRLLELRPPAITLHVGLARENPDVPHQNVGHCRPLRHVAKPVPTSHLDRVLTSSGDVVKPGTENAALRAAYRRPVEAVDHAATSQDTCLDGAVVSRQAAELHISGIFPIALIDAKGLDAVGHEQTPTGGPHREINDNNAFQVLLDEIDKSSMCGMWQVVVACILIEKSQHVAVRHALRAWPAIQFLASLVAQRPRNFHGQLRKPLLYLRDLRCCGV